MIFSGVSVQTQAASLLGCASRDRGIPALCGQGAKAGAGSDGEASYLYAGPGPRRL